MVAATGAVAPARKWSAAGTSVTVAAGQVDAAVRSRSGGAELVVLGGEDQHGTLVAGARPGRRAEAQGRRHGDPTGDPLVADRQGDVGAERVADQPERQVRRQVRGGSARWPRARPAPRRSPSRVAVARRAEVEAQHGHAGGDQRPEDAVDDDVVAVAAVGGMRMAHDRARPGPWRDRQVGVDLDAVARPQPDRTGGRSPSVTP